MPAVDEMVAIMQKIHQAKIACEISYSAARAVSSNVTYKKILEKIIWS